MDFDYQPGMSSDCGKPLCCRSDSGPAKDEGDKAGPWGDYNCDLNTKAMKSMLNFIKDGIQPEAVLWGGDSIPHNVDSLNFEDNVNILKNVTEIVAKELDGIRIYPTIGNHDTYPQDIFSFKHQELILQLMNGCLLGFNLSQIKNNKITF